MDRVAVFVDAGYLYAGGAKSITGADGTKRHEIALDIGKVLRYLISKAETISEQKLLRIYWYDAAPTSGRLTTDHQILASSDHVKLRLGVLNGYGQQKGVDGKVITDLTELSRNRAFADAVLLGGDEDLRIGVELAQKYGTRVHLLTIEGSSPSPTLKQECDTSAVLPSADISDFLTVRTSHAAPGVIPFVAAERKTASTSLASPLSVEMAGEEVRPLAELPIAEPPARLAALETTPAGIDPGRVTPTGADSDFNAVAQTCVRSYLSTLSQPDQAALAEAMKTGAGVPAEHDGRLLARTRKELGRNLDQPEKARLRKALKTELGV
jgi:uncharacterized LabA/DUF88 family protein